MDIELTRNLVCPECKGALKNQNETELLCEPCGARYSIRKGIPDLRPQTLGESEAAGVEKANLIYHDEHADTYEQDRHTTHMFESRCQARLKQVIDYMVQTSGNKRALDLGAGTGNALKYLAEKYDLAVGVDISAAMLELVQKSDAKLLLASALKLPFEDGFFDSVTAFSVLHHLYDPMEGIKEAFRALKPGGIFYSDWDFNRSFRTRLFFSLYIHKFNPFSAARGFMDHFLMKDEESEIFTKAEYHAFKDWLDAEKIKSGMENIGFSDVKLIYHWNAASVIDGNGQPFQPQASLGKKLVTLSSNPAVQNPIFILLAVK